MSEPVWITVSRAGERFGAVEALAPRCVTATGLAVERVRADAPREAA